MSQIANRHAVVFGAGRGIGAAIARALHDAGAELTLVDRDQQVGTVAAELNCHSLRADVTDWDAVQAVAAKCEGQAPVHHVLYAVGLGSGKSGFPFWRMAPSDWKGIFEVNTLGAVHVAHAFVEPMVQRGDGSFVLLASVSGQFGARNDPPYSAAKAALINFGQVMAMDMAEFGVRCNLIAPGIVDTPMQERVYRANVARFVEAQRPDYATWMQEKLDANVPLRRPQTVEDIAEAALYLCRAVNVTGQVLNVDGGWVQKG